ncbi:ABC-2 family transporter protein [Arsukibacterium tuosuense]|uniref:ABC-2 family transporter protein n=1 Tax=Arsukibacterium tuosuense TaxID=1323745 RepID=A0A285J5P5_9GAMM|nr:ABC-2 transporter permease [Arsukibacterium tuosuense]SNY54676.1 ABC-2 family transporter protein [Arsukibacterium tuosuense]
MLNALNNTLMIKLLIVKDWQLMKKSLAAYMVGGVVIIGMMGMATPLMFNSGAIMMITLMIVIGSRSAVELVVNEKKDQTLAFMMSLPVTSQDYALAKLGANLALYLVPWLLLVFGMLLVIVSTPVTNGVIPLVVLVSLFILLSYCCYLATALLTYSEGYTITVMIITNLLLNGFILWIIRMPAVHQTLEAPTASWNSTTLGLLAVGTVLVVCVLLLTAYFQKRKTSFL